MDKAERGARLLAAQWAARIVVLGGETPDAQAERILRAADEAVPVESKRAYDSMCDLVDECRARLAIRPGGVEERLERAEAAARGLAKAAYKLCELDRDPFGLVGSLTDLGECIDGLREALAAHPGWLEEDA